MHDVLKTIVARKHEEVAALRRLGLGTPAGDIAPPRGFARALTAAAEQVAIIAEVKKASPSKGLIQPNFDPVRVARQYAEGGARAISVLTDVDFFQGSIDFLPLVRNAVSLPVLRKDFLIDPLQVRQAALYGADAVLLIVAILTPAQLRELHGLAEELGMDVLTEVHDEPELETALAAGCSLIGINNRNLRDFSVDLETTFRLRPRIPAHVPVVSESGIGSVDDIRRLRQAGVQAALIGESLMRHGDRAALLRELHHG
ncbi:MAG: indole-3-glycerol phosphate synthase [Desulfobulbaceae bacterium A2]|nr:MAG: indole-3-glycerol phosphate synthase [Desulfobulbaceae bacterium A2]